jgi:hypothetical protein
MNLAAKWAPRCELVSQQVLRDKQLLLAEDARQRLAAT